MGKARFFLTGSPLAGYVGFLRPAEVQSFRKVPVHPDDDVPRRRPGSGAREPFEQLLYLMWVVVVWAVDRYRDCKYFGNLQFYLCKGTQAEFFSSGLSHLCIP